MLPFFTTVRAATPDVGGAAGQASWINSSTNEACSSTTASEEMQLTRQLLPSHWSQGHLSSTA